MFLRYTVVWKLTIIIPRTFAYLLYSILPISVIWIENVKISHCCSPVVFCKHHVSLLKCLWKWHTLSLFITSGWCVNARAICCYGFWFVKKYQIHLNFMNRWRDWDRGTLFMTLSGFRYQNHVYKKYRPVFVNLLCIYISPPLNYVL